VTRSTHIGPKDKHREISQFRVRAYTVYRKSRGLFCNMSSFAVHNFQFTHTRTVKFDAEAATGKRKQPSHSLVTLCTNYTIPGVHVYVLWVNKTRANAISRITLWYTRVYLCKQRKIENTTANTPRVQIIYIHKYMVCR
jgi:hypothetical protein